ncbi:MAG: helix-turn-helix domain-containing protein, partial [Gammaproteobacteria bacterium]
MKVFGLQSHIMRSARLADKVCDEPEVVFRLQQLERFERLRKAHGLTASQAAEVPGTSRATLYRWRRRLAEAGTSGLRARSRRPRRVRQRQWGMDLA